jgi:hypothetical protein
VHDAFWTPMARHADIVLPATMTLERNEHRRFAERRLPDRDAPCAAALRPRARRVRDLRRPCRRARSRRAVHRGPRRDGVAPPPVRGLARQDRAGGAGLRGFLEQGRRGRAGAGARSRVVRGVSAGSRTGPPWARRAAASRSSRRPSTGSATTTAPATRRGWRLPSASAQLWPRAIRCTSLPTTRRRACTASSTSVP